MTSKDPGLYNKSSLSQDLSKSVNSPDQAETSKRPVGNVAGSNNRPGGVAPQSVSKAKSPQPATATSKQDKPKPTPQEALQTYYIWLKRLEARALEDDGRRGDDLAQRPAAHRADGQRVVGELLLDLQAVSVVSADVLIGGHAVLRRVGGVGTHRPRVPG